MRNIYQIVDTRTHKVVETGFTHKEDKGKGKGDKKAAKPVRDALNAEVKGDRNPFIVSRGEDHPLGATNGISSRTRGKNSRWI